MTDDISRSTFRKEKHYRKVNMQQGRVQMDADWNEQNDIQFHYEQTFLRDLIGKNGTLIENNGFKIFPAFSFNWDADKIDPDELKKLGIFLKECFRFDNNDLTFTEKRNEIIIKISDGTEIAKIIRTDESAVLTTSDNSNTFEFTKKDNKFHTLGYVIGAGNYYVDGILCENEFPVSSTMQPDLQINNLKKNPPLNTESNYIVYVDVWERHITHIEDEYIREQALGGVDTATRTKIAWQVKHLEISDDKCPHWDNLLPKINPPTTGKLQARAKPSPQNTEKCSIYETAGYVGPENQLYLIEVHKSGTLGNATIKWSRDNGTIVSKIKEFCDQNKIEIEERGKDRLIDFAKDQWVEITDDSHEQLGIVGTLVKLKELNGTTLEYEYDSKISGDEIITKENFPLNPKIRRWESKNGSPLITSDDTEADGYVELEDGVQIKLNEGMYRAGDWWIIPARTKSGKVEWPTGNFTDEPLALLPLGIIHHYAPLALITPGSEFNFKFIKDLRNFFSSLTDLIAIHYSGGDGQEAVLDNSLPSPLRVAVTVGDRSIHTIPLGSATIRFETVPPITGSCLTALDPEYEVKSGSNSVDVKTNNEGIAECKLILGDGQIKQQVKAILLDDCGNATNLPPIYFNATLPISFYYVAGDGDEVLLEDPINLKAGVMIGKTPVADSKYKVQFTVTETNGTLENINLIPLDEFGIASCNWRLDEKNPHQYAMAVLMYADNGDNYLDTNLPPIYFNARSTQNQNTSIATSGILNLYLTHKKEQPMMFGPFEHFLEKLEFPPAVFLGFPDPSKISVIMRMKNSIKTMKQDSSTIEYEAVNIDKERFMVQITSIDSRLPPYVPFTLRWWALPASERTQESSVTIELDKQVYNWTDTVYITVIAPDHSFDTNLVDEIGNNSEKIIIETSQANIIGYKLVETGTDTGIFTGQVILNSGKPTGSGPTDGQITSSNNDFITVSFLTKYGLIQTRASIKEDEPSKVTMTNIRFIDQSGKPVAFIQTNKKVQISADIANETGMKQSFAFLVQIQDSDGVVTSLPHITSLLPAGESLSPALPWNPTEAGTYTVTAFVWESVENPIALSPPVNITVEVKKTD